MNLNPIVEILAESLFLQLKEGQKEILTASSEIPIKDPFLAINLPQQKGTKNR